MDTLTASVLIRITGLLLLSPASGTSNHPTYVLMPTTQERHYAQVGFVSRSGAGCAWYQDRICYVDIDGWSLEIGNAEASTAAQPPYGLPNLSKAVERPVRSDVLAPTPNTAVLRARIALNAGDKAHTCPIARWEFSRDTVELPNVVEWRIPDLGAQTLVLKRSRLDDPSTVDTITILEPEVNGIIYLFIRHVPEAERDHRYKGRVLALGDPATHFAAMYNLLDMTENRNRPLPTYRGRTWNVCAWAVEERIQSLQLQMAMGPERRKPLDLDFLNPGTLTCMPASGTPNLSARHQLT